MTSVAEAICHAERPRLIAHHEVLVLGRSEMDMHEQRQAGARRARRPLRALAGMIATALVSAGVGTIGA